MNKNKLLGMSLLAVASGASAQSVMCLPCPPGTMSLKGATSINQCVSMDKWVKGHVIDKPVAYNVPKGSCVFGEGLTSGVYAVKLTGGSGGYSSDYSGRSVPQPGGVLAYQFYLPHGIASAYNKYRICHGGSGVGSRRHGSGGGAGSWLEIGTGTSASSFAGKYFFVAGGGGGSGEFASDCAGGGGGGGVGAGGGGSDSPKGDCSGPGGSVGPYSTIGQGCSRRDAGGYGQGVKNNGAKGVGYAGGGGGGSGGGNGGRGGYGCRVNINDRITNIAGGASQISTFDIITVDGSVSSTNKVFGGQGGDSSKHNGAPGTTSHASNVSVSAIPGAVALYRMKDPAD
ncbi:MAG: hypothetical protein LBO78_01725 [Rickettsiales bacterium]|nr:hypothetical protein [Rickettsiales bacterium]